MRMNSKLIEMLKRHEGFRNKPYRCSAGKLTIGYGRNLEDVGISRREATLLMLEDIERATQNVTSVFLNFDLFSVNRQNALINMVFNLGIRRFLSFKKMIRAIKKQDWEHASRQARDSKWYGQVGMRSREVVELIKKG